MNIERDCPECDGKGNWYPKVCTRDYQAKVCTSCISGKQRREVTFEDVELKIRQLESVEDYVIMYELRGDEGDYAPTENERLLITDAIYGYIDGIETKYIDLKESVKKAGWKI